MARVSKWIVLFSLSWHSFDHRDRIELRPRHCRLPIRPGPRLLADMPCATGHLERNVKTGLAHAQMQTHIHSTHMHTLNCLNTVLTELPSV